MGVGGVAFMFVEIVEGVGLVELGHEVVAGNFCDDGGGGDGEGEGVALDDGLVLVLEGGERGAVDEEEGFGGEVLGNKSIPEGEAGGFGGLEFLGEGGDEFI